jgi:hypothetical protein
MDATAPPPSTSDQQLPITIFGGNPPKRHKSPGAAFAMSLVVPGTGQLYCGKKRGIATLIFFFAGLIVCIASFASGKPNETVLGIGLRLTLILYSFGFLDAYYTAREVNRDIDLQVDGTNPRVAAVLNLLTKGWGYFYLGHRKAGIIVFLALMVVDGVFRGAPADGKLYLGVLEELSLLVLAVHAWKLAHKEIDPLLAEGEAAVAMNPPKELGKWLPICTGWFVVSIYFALILLGLFMGGKDYSKIDPSTGHVNLLEGGNSEYVNEKYGVRGKFPSGWMVMTGGDTQGFFEAKKTDACQAALVAQQELVHPPDDEALLAELNKKFPGTKLAGMNATKLGPWPANEVQLRIPVRDVEVLQRYVVARRGFTAYVLVLTLGLSECREDTEYIRENLIVK